MEGNTMKCLIINGSSSKSYMWNGVTTKSFTGKLVEEIKSVMEQQGEIKFEEVLLKDINIPYCIGCYNCFYKGEGNCPHHELVQSLVEKISEADCLILTSPVYSLNVSALVKGFFDHTSYLYHRPRFFDKKALVISSTAGGAAKANCKYMRDTLKHWGFNEVYSLPIVRMGANELTEKMKYRCQITAKKFYKDVKSKKLHNPSFKRIFFYQLWRNASIASTAPEADHNYWQKSGLVKHEFAPIIKINIVKRIFSKAVYSMFSKLMK
jgi:multimeric flavodoxin WrbA